MEHLPVTARTINAEYNFIGEFDLFRAFLFLMKVSLLRNLTKQFNFSL